MKKESASCTCPGVVEGLTNEIRRLECLLEAERICHRQTKAKLDKAEHDRDRYQAKLQEYEETKRAVAECIRNGQTIVICGEG